jgi:general secretion pathway protein B
MSLILEALRKSEVERRRGVAPDLLQAAAPAAVVRRPALPTLAYPAVALVLVAAVLLALAWWRRGAPAPTEPPPEIVATSNAPAAVPALPPVAHLRAPTPRPEPPPDAIARAPVQIQPPPTAPAPAPASPPAADAAPVPLSTLPPEQRKALPPLRLSMHLWNPDPARSVAIVDGQRVTRGDRVGDAVVADITREGVVLDWNGEQVLVPLP